MNTLQGAITTGMKTREIVARNLRKARNSRKLSQEQLGFLADVHRTYVGMIEREKYNPTVEMLEKLATALELEVTDFFKIDGDK
ncbi:helix-turn-helix transcriptional regulator [Rhizobium sp. P28RR-XV]|uniref:helix-turn-helix transcriptional regulator n=1 Tax=Rhizobium sp. P28RR-XV TaxID=2726737 RepID=UPI001FED87BF|nr:helix-turn-helix transcriptional regulator [Rhizobium sp. P28RR-XV]